MGLARRARASGSARRGSSPSSQRSVAAIYYEVEPVDASARIVVQSRARGQRARARADRRPARRGRAALARWSPSYHGHHELRAELVHHTRASGLRMAAAMDHIVDGPDGTVTALESEADLARLTVTTELEPGERAAASSSCWPTGGRAGARCRRCATRSTPRWRRPSAPAGRGCSPASASTSTTSGTAPTSRSTATPRCSRRCASRVFHVLQAGARAERRAIPAKGLTGRGYDGHTFWDMETFVLAGAHLHRARGRRRRPALAPFDARAGARRARASWGCAGAAFPWRTIRGQECSGYWPAGTAAFHINADVADAVRRYLAATGDEAFEAGPGARPARRDGAAVALGRPPRRRGRLPDRRRHRPRRVHARSPTTTSTRT